MNSSSADPNSPGNGNADPLPPLDATVEMERPAELRAPPKGEPKPGDETHAPIRRVRPSSKHFEATEPQTLTPIPESDALAPAEPEQSPDATIEMERPAPLSKQPPPAAAPATPVLADVDATVDIARPAEPKKTPTSHYADTEVVDLKTPIPSRHASGTGSGAVHVQGSNTGSSKLRAMPSYARKLGEILVQMEKLAPEQVEEAVQLSNEAGERIGRWLIRWELVTPDVLCRALSIQTGLPMTVLDSESMPPDLSKLFPLALMMHHNFVPFDDTGAVLCLAACNPLDPELLREQEKLQKKVIEVFLAREDQVARQLDWLRIKLKTRSRRCLRYPMRLPISYQFCNRLGVRADKEIHTGTTRNISEGGYLMEGPAVSADPSEQLVKGMYVNVCIKSMTGEIWAVCDVREIRLVEDDRSPRWLMGVEILDINSDSKARLKKLCRKPGKPGQ